MSLDLGELWFTLRLLITTFKDLELHTFSSFHIAAATLYHIRELFYYSCELCTCSGTSVGLVSLLSYSCPRGRLW